MLKINNKDIRTTSVTTLIILTYFNSYFCVAIDDFELISLLG